MEKKDNNRNLAIGQKGEDLAASFLEQKGYSLIARNWRYSHLEVDIIAQHGKTLHFVEVKTLQAYGRGMPEEKVNRKKLNRLQRAAEAYLYQYPEWKYIQFDIVAITLGNKDCPDIFFIEDIA